MNILIADGFRHRINSGYGNLSRNIIFELDKLGHKVYLEPEPSISSGPPWGEIGTNVRRKLEDYEQTNDLRKVDLVLQVASPLSARKFEKPSLIYTQNALSDIPSQWIERLTQNVDGVIVPGQFDKKVFDKYFQYVFIATQSSDSIVFKPRPRYRTEGSDYFTFLFVGSYSYRKGVDLLLEAFLNEFINEPVELVLQCPTHNLKNEVNHLISYMQRINPLAKVRFYGNNISPEWMARLYNQIDCVITLSRGEGWCMPLTEALLCEKPVIAPNSTAMAEYLNEDIALLVNTQEKLVSQIQDPFADGFIKTYGEKNIALYEPNLSEAKINMRRVYEEYEYYNLKARGGRRHILQNFSWEKSGAQVEKACLDFLSNI